MPPINYVPFGRFGEAVGAHFVRSRSAPVTVTAADLSLERVRALLADSGFAFDTPWLPVWREPGHVNVGPWLTAGSVCLPCLRARLDQHDGSKGRSAVARDAQDHTVHHDLWPFLPMHVRTTAGIVENSLSATDPDSRRSVVRYRLDSGEIRRHPVVPVGGCLSCRPGATASQRVKSAVRELRSGRSGR